MEDIINNPKGNALVMREEFELKHFFGDDNNAKLDYVETNDIESVRKLRKDPITEYNLCIIEMKRSEDIELMKIEKEFVGKKDLLGVVINNELPTIYRINYLHK